MVVGTWSKVFAPPVPSTANPTNAVTSLTHSLTRDERSLGRASAGLLAAIPVKPGDATWATISEASRQNSKPGSWRVEHTHSTSTNALMFVFVLSACVDHACTNTFMHHISTCLCGDFSTRVVAQLFMPRNARSETGRRADPGNNIDHNKLCSPCISGRVVHTAAPGARVSVYRPE